MKKKILFPLLIASGIATFFTFLLFAGFFTTWQNRAADSYFLPHKPHEGIVIIAIDDTSIQSIGRWPWKRSVHAELLRKLGTGPVAVGYDVSFPEQSIASEDAMLVEAIKTTRKTILPVEASIINFEGTVTTVQRVLEPIPDLKAVSDVGIVNTIAGVDSITRHIPIAVNRSPSERDEHFSLKLARAYALAQGKPDPTKKVKTENGLMRINFAGKPDTFPAYSFIDVMNGTVPIDTFKNKIVLVGATAVDLHDTQITSVSGSSPMAGVEIHANAVQTILDGKYLVQEPKWMTALTIWVIALLIGVIMSVLGILPASIIVVISAIGYLIYSFVSFDKGVIRNIIYPGLVLITSFVALALYRYFVEYNQRQFLRKAFSFYVSTAVLDEIIKNPAKLSLGGVRKEMTVFFADIEGFTTISERLPPDELSHMLNEYLTRVSKIIFEYNGVIDKFIGDAIMAFWNAPFNDKQHALNACKAAIEIEEEIVRMRKDMEDLNVKNFNVRIGINTGDMVVGNMGSDMRFDYTVLGDNVNLASRMEGINKSYGTKVLISQSTYEMVEDEVVVRFIDTAAVKGKHKGIKMYELRAIGKPLGDDKVIIDMFKEARDLYEAGEFAKALTSFEAVLARFPDDAPSQVFVERCREYIMNPPENWDGIYRSTSK